MKDEEESGSGNKGAYFFILHPSSFILHLSDAHPPDTAIPRHSLRRLAGAGECDRRSGMSSKKHWRRCSNLVMRIEGARPNGCRCARYGVRRLLTCRSKSRPRGLRRAAGTICCRPTSASGEQGIGRRRFPLPASREIEATSAGSGTPKWRTCSAALTHAYVVQPLDAPVMRDGGSRAQPETTTFARSRSTRGAPKE